MPMKRLQRLPFRGRRGCERMQISGVAVAEVAVAEVTVCCRDYRCRGCRFKSCRAEVAEVTIRCRGYRLLQRLPLQRLPIQKLPWQRLPQRLPSVAEVTILAEVTIRCRGYHCRGYRPLQRLPLQRLPSVAEDAVAEVPLQRMQRMTPLQGIAEVADSVDADAKYLQLAKFAVCSRRLALSSKFDESRRRRRRASLMVKFVSM